MTDSFSEDLRSKLTSLRDKKRNKTMRQEPPLSKRTKSNTSNALSSISLPKSSKSKKSSKAISSTSPKFRLLKTPNPFQNLYNSWKQQTECRDKIFASDISDADREVLFTSLPLDSLEEYAWAIPDQRALNIMKEFSPLVEIGCGKGYWCRLLREIGADIVAYDKTVPDPKDAWAKVEKGGSECLSKFPDRTLFLCYPDDFEDNDVSLSAECLQRYHGDTVILVGERLGQTVLLSNPCGKSISIEAQLLLSSNFHLLLSVPLPSFPTSCDSLTVWRRTNRCGIDDEWEFADIPPEERIPIALACPAFAHLLNE